MSALGAFITKTQREVDTLAVAVAKRLAAPITLTKRTPAVESVAVVVDLRQTITATGAATGTAGGGGVFTPRESNYINGAEDFYITDIQWSGFAEFAPTSPQFFGCTPLEASDQGVYPVFTGVDTAAIQPAFFDFEWNFRLARDGSMYNPGTNGSSYVSRRAFGVRNRNRLLSFADPFKVPAGDTLTWLLRPTFLDRVAAATSATDLAVQVLTFNFIMMGYRTGTIAEADYERR